MKRHMNQLMAWICALIMTIGMLMPVTAAEYNAADAEKYNNMVAPTVSRVLYSTSKSVTATVTAGGAPVDLTLTLKNSDDSKKAYSITHGIVNYVMDGSSGKSLSVQFSKKSAWMDKGETAFYIQLNIDEAAEVGAYSLASVEVFYENGTSATFEAKDIQNGNELKLQVNKGTQDMGDIQIDLENKDDINIQTDNDNPEKQVGIYIRKTGTSEIKSVRLYFEYSQTSGGVSVGYEFSNQGSVKKTADGYYWKVRFSSSLPSSTYRMKKIDIVDENGVSKTYYNDDSLSSGKFTAYNNGEIRYTNNVSPDVITLSKVSFINEATGAATNTQTANIADGSANIRFNISIKSVVRDVSLKNATIVFKGVNTGATFDKTVDSNDYIKTGNGDYQFSIAVDSSAEQDTYKVEKVSITSSKDKTLTYAQDKTADTVEFTPAMGKNIKLVVKKNDKISKDEIGSEPKSVTVTKDAAGKSTAQLSLTTETVDEDITDATSKKFANETYTFKVESDSIPDNAKMEIGKVLTGNILDNAKSAMQEINVSEDKIRVFEINVLDNNDKKVQPGGNVSITTDIPSGIDVSKGVIVYRMGDGANGAKIEAQIIPTIENGTVTFVTNHFSTYVIAEKPVVISPNPGPGSGSGSGDSDDYEPATTLVASENRPDSSAKADNADAGSQNVAADNTKAPNTADKSPVVLLIMAMLCSTLICILNIRKEIR